MNRKHILVGVLVGILAATATTALAAQVSPNAFGRGGSTPKLNANCSRAPMFVTPAGKSWDGATPNGKQFTSQALAVVKGQLDCSIRRTNRIIACLATPLPVIVEAPADKTGFHDTKGAAAFAAAVSAQRACVATVTGVVR